MAGSKTSARLIGVREHSEDKGLVLEFLLAIIWISYKIQSDPINMPPDRRASHQPNLENQ